MINVTFDDSAVVQGRETLGVNTTSISTDHAAYTKTITYSDAVVSMDATAVTEISASFHLDDSTDIMEVESVDDDLIIEDNAVYVAESGSVTGYAVVSDGVFDEYKTPKFTVDYPGGTKTYTTVSYTDGSLINHMYENIANAVSGLTASDATRLRYTSATYDLDSPAAVINEDAWTAAWDFSCVAFCRFNADGSSMSGTQPIFAFTPTLITQRHALCSYHTGTAVGSIAVFRLPDGTFHNAVVEKYYSYSDADWIVLQFTEDVPSSITPALLMPSNILDYMPSCAGNTYTETYDNALFPTIMKGARLGDGTASNLFKVEIARLWMNDITLKAKLNNGFASHISGTPMSGLSSWIQAVKGGDSSSPTFVIVNGRPVFLMLQYSVGGGPTFIGSDATEVQAAINSLSGTTQYRLSCVDLSGF